MDNKEKTPGRHNNWPQLGSPQIEQIRKEKGKKNKTQGMKEINKKKYAMHVNQIIMKSKTVA